MTNLTVALRNSAKARKKHLTPNVEILSTALIRITEIPGLIGGTRSAHFVGFSEIIHFFLSANGRVIPQVGPRPLP